MDEAKNNGISLKEVGVKYNFLRMIIFCLLVTMILAGCSGSGEFNSTPTEIPHPHIRGEITSLSINNDGSIGLLVEGKLESDTQYDKAYIRVLQETSIWIKTAEGMKPGKLSDLEKGQTVEVTFVGAIATSYPAQATAGKVVILR